MINSNDKLHIGIMKLYLLTLKYKNHIIKIFINNNLHNVYNLYYVILLSKRVSKYPQFKL